MDGKRPYETTNIVGVVLTENKCTYEMAAEVLVEIFDGEDSGGGEEVLVVVVAQVVTQR